MAAAYAALVSLMNLTDQIQNHPQFSITFRKEQIGSLQEKVGFLLDFVENYSNGGGGSGEAETLEIESRISSAAYAAEDAIESHVVDQIHAESIDNWTPTCISLLDLQRVIQDLDSVKEKVLATIKEERALFKEDTVQDANSSRPPPTTVNNNTTVGFDDELIQLVELLTREQRNRQIISIVGMGGIGKTTLARNVYEKLLVTKYFDVRAWVTISRNYSVREILSQLLSYPIRELSGDTEYWGTMLHQRLSGRRYLIILDDVWSIEALEKIKLYFPDNGNGSRIVVTTRLTNLDNDSINLAMNFLDENRSWKLFCEKAFAQECCPPELEEIGKEIVRKCKGLPLSLVAIGGLLGKSDRTQEYWKNVAKDITPILNSSDEGEHCSNILSLSYSYLPTHLKPCFLYMGIFSNDQEIRVSRLIKLWAAEGFLKPNKGQSLEEVAESYLKDLIDRNLIMVRRLGLSKEGGVKRKVKTCNIHDLMRNLCLQIAEKERFLCVMRAVNIPQGVERERRIVLDEPIPLRKYNPRVFDALQSASLARSLICKGGWPSFTCRLLRVLTEVDSDSMEAIFQQVNMRYLAYIQTPSSTSKLPSSISLLWNVQTIIIRGNLWQSIVAPPEIWYMPQLRHVECNNLCLPDPPSDQQDDGIVMRNLQTLKRVVDCRWNEQVSKRIPNLKKLHIEYSYIAGSQINSSGETIILNNRTLNRVDAVDLLQNLTFLSSLQKLNLLNCGFHWDDLRTIGSLPRLEVLKLERVRGVEWNTVDQEGLFLQLKFLKIKWSDLIHWNADSSNFPVLEILVLEGLTKLDEIPSGIGEIPTLRDITLLHSCSESAAISAVRILDEQVSLGNDDGFRVRIKFFERQLESFKEKAKQFGSFTSNNLHLEGY